MLKLLRRDLDWILAFTLIASALVCSIVFDKSRTTLFVLPFGRHLEDLFGALTLIGAVLGIFVGLRDRLARTEDWIRHRPVSPRTLAFQQHLTSLVVLALWFLVPLLLRRLTALENDRDFTDPAMTAIAVDDDPARWAALLAMTTLTWTGYALAFFTTRAPGSVTVKGLCGAALAAVWLFLSWCFMEEHWRLEPWTFALLQIGLTAHLLGLAFRNETEANDPDRPSSTFCLRANVLTLGLALALGAGVVATELQSKAFNELIRSWPQIHRCDDRFFLLAAEKDETETWKTVVVDAEHRPQREVDVPDWNVRNRLGNIDLFYFGRRSFDPGMHTSNAEFGLGDRNEVDSSRPDDLWVLALDAGEVRLRRGWRNFGPAPVPSRISIRRDDGRSLSTSSRFMPWFESGGASLIHDLEDWTFWRIEDGVEPRLRRVAFPENDRIVDLVPHVYEEGDRGEVLALGELSAYRFDGENLVPIGLDWPCLGMRTMIEDRDPLAPLVVVRDSFARELFRHQFGPYTADERLSGGLVLAAGLLRAPLAHLVSLGAGEIPAFAPKETRAIIDPFTASAQRFGIVLLSLFVGGALGVLQYFRLKKLGAEVGRRRFWFVAILLGGPALMLLAFLTERARAHRRLALPESPTLLLKSA